jgi:hypothetical protein
MTSSARARIDGGIVRPSPLAVLRLTTSSNVVGCWTDVPPHKVPRAWAKVLYMYYSVRRAWYDPALNFCATVHLANPATISPDGWDTANPAVRG